MHPAHILALVLAGAASVGCGAAPPGGPPGTDPSPAPSQAPSSLPSPKDTAVHGLAVGVDGSALAGVQVSFLPSDPYLVPVVTTQSDASGSFTLNGVPGDARDWITFVAPGYMPQVQAFDTTGEASQTLPAAPLWTVADATSVAQGLGATLGANKAAMSVPVVVAGQDGTLPASAGDVVVSLQPAPDDPVRYARGAAVATNLAYETYQVTVTRGGRLCATAAHPSLVAADGSITVRVFAGTWSVGPTVVCN
jgi:hypothetical protein